MSIFESVFDTLKTFVTSKSDKELLESKFDKANMTKLLENQRLAINSIQTVLKSMSPPDMLTLTARYMDVVGSGTIKNKNNVSDVIPYIKTKLNNGALKEEQKMTFGAALKTADVFNKVLNELYNKVDVFMTSEYMTILDTKISTVLLMGTIMEIERFTYMTNYLYAHFSKTISTKEVDIPIQYQAKFIREQLDAYINLLNIYCNQQPNYSFLKDVASLRVKHQDVFLRQEDRTFMDTIDKKQFNASSRNKLTMGIIGFNLVGTLVGMWNDYVHNKYLANKEMREWMEHNLALLKMELQGTRSDSDREKLLKIIDAYEAKIANISRKIEDYERED